MKFNSMKIGIKLGIGFSLILLAATLILSATLFHSARTRASLLETIHRTSEQADLAVAMRTALLSSAVSVRNMGLQTKVEDVQRDQDRANKNRQNYLSIKQRLRGAASGSKELQVFSRLAPIDQQMDDYFKEAVDLASQFNTEQASAIITSKIDPLLIQSIEEIDAFIELKKSEASVALEEDNQASSQATTFIVAAGLAVLVFAALMSWKLTLSITGPIQAALAATSHIAQGDLDCQIAPPRNGLKEETALLISGLIEMRDSLTRMVREVRHGADNISTGAHEIANGNSDLSQRTEVQASNLQQTAASMSELSGTVRSNADTAQEAKRVAGLASQAALDGGVVVERVIQTMSEITQASNRITDIIGVIDGIAFQTNILALNAAVEAARAGEQGRGFAVVADEVRTLASRSATAAKEIKTLIGASVDKVELGSQLVGTAGQSMRNIVEQVKNVAGLITDISQSAHAQSHGIEQINQAIAQLDNVTQQNSALVEEAAAAAANLNQQARRMVQAVSAFKIDSALVERVLPAPVGRMRLASSRLG